MLYECSFSRALIFSGEIPADKRVVECPECGAVRKGYVEADRLHYAVHPTLDGMTRLKPRWKRINGMWTYIETDEARQH